MKRYLKVCQIVAGGIFVSRLVLRNDFLRLCKAFLLQKQPFSLNFLCHVQICIAIGDCFENSLTNAYSTFLFEYDQAYSNTQNFFSLPLKGITISVRIKTSYFDLLKNMQKK